MTSFLYLGETLSLLTAVAWAFAVILFKKSGETVHPIALNTFKNLLAMVLFFSTMLLAGETLFLPVPAKDYLLLFLSGALGIGIADSLFFKSLNLLGAGMTAIVDCMYSPFIIGMSMIWLGERMTFWQLIGTLAIISAVLTVISRKERVNANRRNLAFGIFYGIVAIAFIALGVVIVKPILDRSPVLWTISMRLIGGMAMLALMLAFHPKRTAVLSSLITIKGWKYTLSGSFIGAYLALLLWMFGMKYTQASIAAVLNQTSNIFVFIFAALFLHEPINCQRTVGILLGVSGALLITFT